MEELIRQKPEGPIMQQSAEKIYRKPPQKRSQKQHLLSMAHLTRGSIGSALRAFDKAIAGAEIMTPATYLHWQDLVEGATTLFEKAKDFEVTYWATHEQPDAKEGNDNRSLLELKSETQIPNPTNTLEE